MLMARGVADPRVNARRFRLPARLTLRSVVMVAVTVLTGFATRESVAGDGAQGRMESLRPFLSGDGRYVAFESVLRQLLAGRVYWTQGVLVRDRQTGTTELASIAADGSPDRAPCSARGISADGRYVLFHHDSKGLFVRDRQADRTEWVTDNSYLSVLSANGRYIAFESEASDLVPDDTNDALDIFVHDRQTGTTQRVSMASDGTQGSSASGSPSLSADGRYVAFHSDASNLVAGSISGKGGVFVHDWRTGKTERVSVASDGTQADKGGFVPREGFLGSLSPALSADGRYVAFTSHAANLVSGDTSGATDIFVHDRWTRKTERVSLFRDESIVEAWHRGGFNSPVSLSVYPVDGSCWVADPAAARVVHLARNGETMWSGGDFRSPCSASVNSQDGSCYIADSQGKQVARLAADGSDVWRKEGFAAPSLVTVNHNDGSCWVIDAGALIHLSADGTELSRAHTFATGSAVNPMDGSSWASDWSDPEKADRPAHEVHSALVHLSADGRQLWRLSATGWYAGFEATAVNPVDGSCWAAWLERRHDVGRYDSKVIHFAADGRQLWEATGFEPEMRLSVSPHDGSCWVTSRSRLTHLAADGRELSRPPPRATRSLLPTSRTTPSGWHGPAAAWCCGSWSTESPAGEGSTANRGGSPRPSDGKARFGTTISQRKLHSSPNPGPRPHLETVRY